MSKSTPIVATAELLAPCRHRVHVEAPADRVAQEEEHALRAAAEGIKFPGYRPGKAPLSMIRTRLGASADAEVRQHLFEHLIGDAIRESELHVLRLLEFDPSGIEIPEGKPLAFDFEVETAPTIETPDLSSLTVEAMPTDPTEDQIQEALASMGSDHPRFDPSAEGQTLDEEHLAMTDLTFFRNEEEGPSADGLRMSLGSPLLGADPEVYKEKLSGVAAGGTVQVPLEFREGFEKTEWVGSQGVARLAVREIVKPRPATPEEVAEELKMEGVDALREAIASQLQSMNGEQELARQEVALLDAIYATAPFELPSRLLEEEIEQEVQTHQKRLQEQAGLDEEAAATEAAKAREQLAEVKETNLRRYFLMRRIAADADIRVSEKELREEFARIAAQHGADPAAVRKFYEEQNRTNGVISEILDRKTRTLLREKATVHPVPAATTEIEEPETTETS